MAQLVTTITWVEIEKPEQVPNRVPLLFLRNGNTKEVFAGWFLSGGNAAGLDEAFYSYEYRLNEAWTFNRIDEVTHYADPTEMTAG